MKTKEDQIKTTKIIDGIAHIDISTDKFPNSYMICDEDDFVKWKNESSYGSIHAWKHSTCSYPYAIISGISSNNTRFHRMVYPSFKIIDHIDHNGLNNCKDNLRDGMNGINEWNKGKRIDNKCGVKGVFYRSSCGKYRSNIQLKGKKKHLGYFKTPEEASERYKLAEKRRWEGLPLDQL